MYLPYLGWAIAALAATPLETTLLGVDQPRALLASALAALLFGGAHALIRTSAERDALAFALEERQRGF